MLPLSFRKAITEPEKVIAPIATPSPISIRLTMWMSPSALGDAEGERVEERGRADQHRGHADEAVEGGDELRHRGHRDPPRGDEADHCADRDRAQDLHRDDPVDIVAACRHPDRPAGTAGNGQASSPARAPCRTCRSGCRAASFPGWTAPQGEDEADARDQIGEQHPGRRRHRRIGQGHMFPRHGHISAPSSCTWRACAA